MKVTRSFHVRSGLPGKTPAVPGAKGKAFAAKLGQTERAAATTGPARGTPVHQAAAVADIGAQLKAGKITAEAAIDKIVERVLDRHLGKQASAGLRAKIGTALRESLADDPLLAAKVRALSQG
jgi:hypothetical protein